MTEESLFQTIEILHPNFVGIWNENKRSNFFYTTTQLIILTLNLPIQSH
jgi:hypothetical protein